MKKIKQLTLLMLVAVSSVYSQDFSGLSPAPTSFSCGCLVLDATKQTKKTSKEGTVTVYKDEMTFSFGSSVKTFFLYSDGVYEDEKGKVYLLKKEGEYYFIKASSTYYLFKY